MAGGLRIGIDLGGTKIAGIALGEDGRVMAEAREPTPRDDYDGSLAAIARMIELLERHAGGRGTIGIGIPGSISPRTGLAQNANSQWLNGRHLQRDMEERLDRDVRLSNDANCFALSEAHDGAAKGAAVVFGVILGTGCGGGVVVNGRILDGPHRTGGEWGHMPLPWPTFDECPGPRCWCGRSSCMERWVAGPSISADHARRTGMSMSTEEIAAAASKGNPAARETLELHADRLARGLAVIVNILDPDVIVLGGGVSSMGHLYQDLPSLMAPHIFSDTPHPVIRPPVHGPASGVRGAARLWD